MTVIPVLPKHSGDCAVVIATSKYLPGLYTKKLKPVGQSGNLLPALVSLIFLLLAASSGKPSLEEIERYAATETFPQDSFLGTVAYPEDVRKKLRKFLPYLKEFDAGTYVSVFDREFFRVLDNDRIQSNTSKQNISKIKSWTNTKLTRCLRHSG
jgi:hypothetical protein